MERFSESEPVKVAVIGAGAVSDYHHVPAIKLDPRAKLVAVCDTDQALLERRKSDWSVERVSSGYQQICADPGVDAVIIATPNFSHKPIALAAAAGGKHIMCEKPLGLNAAEVREVYHAACAAGVVHMTAFTYRFAPAMRYIRHLLRSGALGEPRHFRSQRFLDLPETSWGWRQYKETAGAGDLFDMTIHRIDFAIDLLGPLTQVCGAVARFAPRDVTDHGQRCAPSDVDDWSALIGRFESGAVGVWEGTTLAKGYRLNGYGHEWAEINGSQRSAIYRLHEPNTVWLGKTGEDVAPEPVPAEFLKPSDSPRDPGEGVPATVFRYDVMWEFISAICAQREAAPNFYDGLRAQIVADLVLQSNAEGRWFDVPNEPRHP